MKDLDLRGGLGGCQYHILIEMYMDFFPRKIFFGEGGGVWKMGVICVCVCVWV